MSTPWPRPTVVTASRSGKTSPVSSIRRNGVSTEALPSIGAVTKVLPPGYPRVTGPIVRLPGRPGYTVVTAGPGNGKLRSGKPGGTCMADRPADAGSGRGLAPMSNVTSPLDAAAPPPASHRAARPRESGAARDREGAGASGLAWVP